jgi:hypothetical protein
MWNWSRSICSSVKVVLAAHCSADRELFFLYTVLIDFDLTQLARKTCGERRIKSPSLVRFPRASSRPILLVVVIAGVSSPSVQACKL